MNICFKETNQYQKSTFNFKKGYCYMYVIIDKAQLSPVSLQHLEKKIRNQR